MLFLSLVISVVFFPLHVILDHRSVAYLMISTMLIKPFAVF